MRCNTNNEKHILIYNYLLVCAVFRICADAASIDFFFSLNPFLTNKETCNAIKIIYIYTFFL